MATATTVSGRERLAARGFAFAGQYEEAFALYKALLTADADPPADILSEAGFVCMQMKLVDQAEECFRRALTKDPQNVSALMNSVDIRLGLGRLDEDIESLFNRLRALQPESAEVTLLAARRMFLKGRPLEGKRLALSITVEPGRPVDIGLVTKLLVEQECFAEAVGLAEEALKVGKVHPYLFQYSGQALIKLGWFDKASGLFQLARDLYPDRAFPLCGLAATCLGRQEYGAAEVFLDIALQIVPEYAEATYMRFTTLAAQGKWASLLSATKPFLDREPPVLIAIGFHNAALKELGLTEGETSDGVK